MGRKNAEQKLKSLKSSLALCGVKTKLYKTKNGVMLYGKLFNNVNGENETFAFGAIADDNYKEMYNMVSSPSDDRAFLQRIAEW